MSGGEVHAPNGGSEQQLWRVLETRRMRDLWRMRRAEAVTHGANEVVSMADEALAELAEVTAIDALAAIGQLARRLTEDRLRYMGMALEEGAGWDAIAGALGMRKQSANAWYRERIRKARTEDPP